MSSNATNGVDPSTAGFDYVALEATIGGLEEIAILGRWEFGRALLAERNGKKQLPNGRLAEVAKMIGHKTHRELHFRMSFAAKYGSEETVRTAVRTYGSWTAIRESLSIQKPKPVPKLRTGPAMATVPTVTRSVPDADWLDQLESAIETIEIKALPAEASDETLFRVRAVAKSLKALGTELDQMVNSKFKDAKEAGQMEFAA